MAIRRVFVGLFAGLAALLAGPGCKTAAPIHPRALEHNQYCVQYLQKGDLERAEVRCKLALEFNPDYPDPLNNLGLIELRRNHWDEAKDYFIRAIHLNQDFAEAHNSLGFVFLHQESYGKAHDEFIRALKVNPDAVEPRYNLALTYYKMKKYDDARRTYLQLIESNGKIADPHHDLCAMDIDQGDYDEAVKECTLALQLDPHYVSALFNLGNAYLKSGKFCEAQDAYAECLRVDQANAECRTNVTVAAQKCALLDPSLRPAPGDGAGRAAREVPTGELNPDYATGLAQVERGLLNEARHSFNRCLRSEPHVAACYFQLFKLDAAVQDAAAARSDCKSLLGSPVEGPASALADERGQCRRYLSQDGQ